MDPHRLQTSHTSERRKKHPIFGAQMGDDLLIEFISRLPTKSLSRFQCVSKSWCSFISDISSQRKSRILLPVSSLFIRLVRTPGLYATIPMQKDDFLFESRLKSISFQSTHIYVTHSCNGLLLFADKKNPCLYYVWNPTSMEFFSLPETRNWDFCGRCFLAFDPRESPNFKVVLFTYSMDQIIVEIYSSLTGNWDECSFPIRYHIWDPMSVFRNGFIHMLTHEYLVRYDIENGSFHWDLLPEKIDSSLFRMACIGESRGQLYYAVNITPRYELRIYMLDDRTNDTKEMQMKWLPIHTISTKFLISHPLMRWGSAGVAPCPNFRPIGFHPGTEVIYLSTPSKILRYHPSSDKLDEVCKVTEDVDWTRVFSFSPCFESINPPGSKFVDPLSLKYIM